MFTLPITYDDFNDNQVTENFSFHISLLDAIEMELQFEGGLEGQMKRLTETNEGEKAYYLFKDIILSAYGVKAPDGSDFDQSPEVRAKFERSPALGELIYGFIRDPDSGARFVQQCLPKRLIAQAQAAAQKQEQESSTPELATAPPVLAPAGDTETTEPTDEELLKMKPQDMTRAQMERAFVLKTQA